MVEWRENQLPYSNRATRALGDVLRRLTQPRGRRCRGTPDLSNGYTGSASRLHWASSGY
jgi:hypothetical protein